MLLLRLLGILTVLTIGASVLTWVFSRDRRYLRFAWRITQGALVVALTLMGLMAAERLMVF
jgi:hypothetical protein